MNKDKVVFPPLGKDTLYNEDFHMRYLLEGNTSLESMVLVNSFTKAALGIKAEAPSAKGDLSLEMALAFSGLGSEEIMYQKYAQARFDAAEVQGQKAGEAVNRGAKNAISWIGRQLG